MDNVQLLDKEHFNSLDVLEQIKYFNDLLDVGYSITAICNYMRVSKKTIKNRFEKVYFKYDNESKQYIKSIPEEIKGQINFNELVDKQKVEPKQEPENRSIDDIYIKLEQMQKEINIIKTSNMINTNNTINNNNTSNTLNTVLMERLDTLRGDKESVSRVYRVNADIQKEFKTLCRRHLGDGINISDLMSLCMLEFIEKYK